MAAYFFDTSAIVKRYFHEQGSLWMRLLCDPTAGNDLFIAAITIAETITTFARMVRENPPRSTTQDRDQAIALFRHDVRQSYHIITLTPAFFNRAGDIACRQPLRSYDAVQLASALRVHARLSSAGQTSLPFVSADTMLLQVAAAEGLSIANPNDYA